MSDERQIVYGVWLYAWEDTKLLGLYTNLADATKHVMAARRKHVLLNIERYSILDGFPGLRRAEPFSEDGGLPKGWLSEQLEGPAIPLSMQPRWSFPASMGMPTQATVKRPE